MKILKITLLLLIITFFTSAQNNPTANSKSIIIRDNVRFTILTPELIRMEWSQSNAFNDLKTFTFINRYLTKPDFNLIENNEILTIQTEKLVLTYKLGSGKFSADNLKIISRTPNCKFDWFPGKEDIGNLRGTTRTLDGWNGGTSDKLEKGLLSRDGWVLIDDSKSFLLDDSSWPWVKELNNETDYQDLYFFGYGRNFKKCLLDYTKVAGKIPIPPKFAFGNWWSKYWIYSDYDVRKLIEEFQTFDIPLDVFIIDMDWHYTYGLNWINPKRDPFGEPVGWTGYTWNKSLFPNPQAILDYKEKLNIKTALNLHPASGISPDEKNYYNFLTNYDTKVKQGDYIPYKMEDKKFAEVFFEQILKPLENTGVDFWWLDWQQWPFTKTIDSLSNTWWLNYTFFTNMERSGKRPLLFHRWGGLGNHRYQIGFSGDALISWQSLNFQPYFTSTASNVGYGYWSHDLGGHIPMGIKTDPELYLRWLQYGVFSPIFRTHSTKSKLIERKIWKFPDHFDSMKEAIKLRYTLVPYIYRTARETYETGISLCRPMYYEQPYEENAYRYKNQYYFGDDILVSPITSPVDSDTQLSYQNLWIPDGEWFEYCSGSVLSGNKEIKRKYNLSEIPFFIKSGSIIPTYQNVKNLSQENNAYNLFIIPGKDSQSIIYEDNQDLLEYQSNKYSKTLISTKYIKNHILEVTINKSEGEYINKPDSIEYSISIPNSLPPKTVRISTNNKDAKNLSWTYSGYKLETKILCGKLATNSNVKIEIEFEKDILQTFNRLSSVKGKFKRLRSVLTNFKYVAGGEYALPDSLFELEQTPTRINYNFNAADREIDRFINIYKALEISLSSLEIGNKKEVLKGIKQLYYDLTEDENDYFTNYEIKLKSLDKRINYLNSFSEKYSGGGKIALFDDRYGTKNYLNPAWQGFEENDMELTIDLEKIQKLNSISINALQNNLYWIFFPVKFEFEISDDNVSYKKCGEFKNNISPNNKDIIINTFKYQFSNCIGRYLKIKIVNIGKCPEWHHGKGGKAWMFIDEIKLN